MVRNEAQGLLQPHAREKVWESSAAFARAVLWAQDRRYLTDVRGGSEKRGDLCWNNKGHRGQLQADR